MMRNETPIHDQQKSKVVDSLLDALYENEKDRAQFLVSSGMGLLDRDATSRRSNDRSNASVARRALGRWQTIALVTAALTLVAVFFPFFNRPNNAIAAVTRSIQQSLQDVGRHYKVASIIRVSEDSLVSREADLFVKGGDRFAIKASTMVGNVPIWLGNEQGKAWVVPPVGPVIQGDTRSLIGWVALQDEISTPYLHLSTALERLRDDYVLETLPQEILQTDTRNVTCQHIVGNLIGKGSPQTPDRIELWADSTSGVARKIIAKWELENGEFGRETVTIEFQEDINLANEFFGPDEHGGFDRQRIDFGTAKTNSSN